MLGTFLICDFKRGLHYSAPGLHLGAEGPCPPGFSHSLVWQDQHSHLSCTTREHYPVFSWETDDLLVHLEGRIYHPEGPQLTIHLSDLARLIFEEKIDSRPRLARWLLGADGDFLRHSDRAWSLQRDRSQRKAELAARWF